MATRNTEPTNEENLTAQPEPDTNQEQENRTEPAQKPKRAEKPKDEWEEMVSVIVPRKPRGEEPTHYVCVNDRRFLLPANGKEQTMPKPIAEALQRSIEAEADAEDYADHIPNRSGEQPQQHAIGG